MIHYIGKVAVYKMSTQESTVFVYTNNSIFEKEPVTPFSFIIAAKEM